MVAIGTQTVFAIGEETTYGTAVVPTRGVPIISESLKLQTTTLNDPSLYPGSGYRAQRGQTRSRTGRMASGDFKFAVTTKSIGLLLKHIMANAPTVVQQAATTAYLQTYTPGLSGGKSLTIQKQIRDNAGNVVGCFDYTGCKIAKVEFSIAVNGVLECTVSVDARNEVKQATPATVTYGTGRPFTFQQGTVKFNGTAVTTDIIKDAKVTIERPMDTERMGLGNGGLKSEPPEVEYMKLGGSLTSEFNNYTTYYDRFDQDTAFEFILLFEGATIASTYKETFEIKIPEIHLDGESPAVGGPGLVGLNVPFTGYDDGTNPSVTVRYMTTDAAA